MRSAQTLLANGLTYRRVGHLFAAWCAADPPRYHGQAGGLSRVQTCVEKISMIPKRGLNRNGQLLAGDAHAIDKGIWSYASLRTRGNTIEAGTSEVPHKHHWAFIGSGLREATKGISHAIWLE